MFFVNASGQRLTPQVYQDARPFSRSRAAVKRIGLWGFIDAKGREVNSVRYTAVNFRGTWQLVNSTGAPVKTLAVDSLSPFFDDIARIKRGGRPGYVTAKGDVVYLEEPVSISAVDIPHYIPNAFTPAGDGINDVFLVQGKSIGLLKTLHIFNRWGELVFEKQNAPANNPAYGWNGCIRGYNDLRLNRKYVFKLGVSGPAFTAGQLPV